MGVSGRKLTLLGAVFALAAAVVASGLVAVGRFGRGGDGPTPDSASEGIPSSSPGGPPDGPSDARTPTGASTRAPRPQPPRAAPPTPVAGRPDEAAGVRGAGGAAGSGLKGPDARDGAGVGADARDGGATGGSAGSSSTTSRPGGSTAPDRPPRAEVPSEAAAIDAASGLRAWLVCVREPRGLASEPAAIPGRVEVRLSQAAKFALTFQVEADPPDAVRLPGRLGGAVRIPAGRDVGSLVVTGLRPGIVSITLRLTEGGDAGTTPPLRVSLDVRSHEDFADPLVIVTTEAPARGDGAGSLVTGERRLAGLRGALCGSLRIRRTGFRGFATTPTDVALVLDDAAGILGPLPAVVTIAAGATEPAEPCIVRLRDVEGRATLRVRAAGAETEIAVESVTPRWSGPESVVVPMSRVARVRLTCRPGTEAAPAWTAAADDSSVVTARAAAAGAAPAEEGVVATLEPRATGETIVRVQAPLRPEFALRVGVVPAEVVLRDGCPSLVGVPAGARGTVTLTPAPPARFERVADRAPPDGVRVEVAKSGAAIVTIETVTIETVRIEAPLGSSATLDIPVRLTGGGSQTRVRVADAVRSPRRAEYEVDGAP